MPLLRPPAALSKGLTCVALMVYVLFQDYLLEPRRSQIRLDVTHNPEVGVGVPSVSNEYEYAGRIERG